MKTPEKLMYVLGGVIVLGFFLLLLVLIFKQTPEGNKDVLNLTIGSLISAFATVVGYFYGSSKGSKDKSEMLNKKVSDNAPVQPDPTDPPR